MRLLTNELYFSPNSDDVSAFTVAAGRRREDSSFFLGVLLSKKKFDVCR